MTVSRAAVVDIGTNSVLLTIARRSPAPEDSAASRAASATATQDRAATTIRAEVERATITRLGEGVDRTRRLAPAAIERTLACLRDYGELIRAAQVDAVALVGTSALRDAQGSDEFLQTAETLVGAPVEIIAGEREAELTFRGALSGLPPITGQVTVFDIGGGSTEIVAGRVPSRSPSHDSSAPTEATARAPAELGRRTGLEVIHSFDVGSVRLTERHVRCDPPTRAELAALRDDIRATWSSLGAPDASALPAATIVGVAGTVTTLAALALELPTYDPEKVHGASLDLETIQRLAERLAAMPLEARRQLPSLEPRRADVIVAGAILCEEVLRYVGGTRLLVSDRGVRWGLLEELFDPSDR